ncbi:MAG: hypothetical protein KAY32_14620 [Candidatus Eisenbacteria sp.]|nr:hypothetical protein [Candidatus Eisenbacteria bacterium]
MSGPFLAELLAGLVDRRAAAVLVTGGIGVGKSRACRQAADSLQRRGMRVGGIVALRVVAAGETIGYDVVDVASGGHRPLARRDSFGDQAGRSAQWIGERAPANSTGHPSGCGAGRPPAPGSGVGRPPAGHVGRFSMMPGGLALARQALGSAAESARIVFVDEIGPWELQGGGLAEPLRRLLGRPVILTLVVRPALVDRVARAFALPGHRLWRIPEAGDSRTPTPARAGTARRCPRRRLGP